MVWFLARRNLRRSVSRTVLLIAGVSIAGALLFDMSMLAGGLTESFGAILGRLGYEIRVVLRGTLPLSTEAPLTRADAIATRIAARRDVAWVSPILVTNLYLEADGRRTTAVALGIRPEVHGIVQIDGGTGEFRGAVVNHELARQVGLAPGQRVRLAARISPQTGAPTGSAVVRVADVGDFVFDLRGQRTIALPLDDLRGILGLAGGQASFLVAKVRAGADPEAIARGIDETFPALEAVSITGLLEQGRRQLTYLNHFSAILSTVSMLVALLLIGTVLTLAIGERLGEVATLRAMGLSRRRLIVLVVTEGGILAAAAIPLALALGAAVSRPLDAILRATPGLPQDLHFFIPGTTAVVRTAVLLLVTGTLGAAYPAWIAGRLNVAATLHQEVQ